MSFHDEQIMSWSFTWNLQVNNEYAPSGYENENENIAYNNIYYE